MPDITYTPRLIFWEMTTACNLNCIHCRACPAEQPSPDDLSTNDGKLLLDSIASWSSPAVVLSGGEPLVRSDVFELAEYGTNLGLRMLLATNGTLVTPEIAEKIRLAGIQRVAVSIDGSSAASHDAFRQVDGAYDGAWRGIDCLKAESVPFQINTSVTRMNIDQIPEILDTAVKSGAAALHLFLLVPTGCGKEIADSEMITPAEYERILDWLYTESLTSPIHLKATCAPHYYRIMHQRAKAEKREMVSSAHGHNAITKGCLAGSSVCFISHSGTVYPCGYLPVSAGNIREAAFKSIWDDAEVFRLLRDDSNLTGKCGYCDYRKVCMGCRARAYAYTGSYLSSEPYCIYEPVNRTPDIG